MARKKREAGFEIQEVVPMYDRASAVLAARMMVAEALASRYGVAAPALKDLAPLLVDLPAFISRESVGSVLGLPVSPKTLANHDYLGTGPRLRFLVNNKTVYPAAFLLEWAEAQNFRSIVSKPVVKVS